MEPEKIIYQAKPALFNLFGIIAIIPFGIFFVFNSDTLATKFFMGGIFALIVVFGIIKNFYSYGIKITENEIELFKNSLNGKSESENINFTNLEKISWNQGGYRQDRAIYIHRTGHSKMKVRISDGPFKFGHVLKFLNDKGIKIELIHSDYELRMYIDGKINEFPMQNEKTA